MVLTSVISLGGLNRCDQRFYKRFHAQFFESGLLKISLCIITLVESELISGAPFVLRMLKAHRFAEAEATRIGLQIFL